MSGSYRMTGEENTDAIHIDELELHAHIGVPEEERARPQRLTISITMWPRIGFTELDDHLERTVNYAAVCREVKELIARRTDKLLETLADVVARHLLEKFQICKVHVELRKFILSDTKYVCVRATRTQA